MEVSLKVDLGTEVRAEAPELLNHESMVVGWVVLRDSPQDSSSELTIFCETAGQAGRVAKEFARLESLMLVREQQKKNMRYA